MYPLPCYFHRSGEMKRKRMNNDYGKSTVMLHSNQNQGAKDEKL